MEKEGISDGGCVIAWACMAQSFFINDVIYDSSSRINSEFTIYREMHSNKSGVTLLCSKIMIRYTLPPKQKTSSEV